MNIILGLDPSLRSSGYGVIAVSGNQMRALEYGCIQNPSSLIPSRCLVKISDTIRDLILRHQPTVMAVEGLVYVQNTRIALTLGQVRGAAIAVAAAHGLEIYEYAPRKIKLSVTGLGGAGKGQVARMIRTLLALPEIPPDDAGDALAIAMCHVQATTGIQLNPPKQI